MPRSVRESDEDVDARPERRLRSLAETADSLRRSKRLKMHKQDTSPEVSPVTSQVKSRRHTGQETSKNMKSLRPRVNSISSDVAEKDETPKSRANDTVNSRRSSRLMRSSSEVSVSSPVTRTTQQSQGNSMEPDSMSDHQKVKKGHLILPTECTLVKEKEEILMNPTVSLERTVATQSLMGKVGGESCLEEDKEAEKENLVEDKENLVDDEKENRDDPNADSQQCLTVALSKGNCKDNTSSKDRWKSIIDEDTESLEDNCIKFPTGITESHTSNVDIENIEESIEIVETSTESIEKTGNMNESIGNNEGTKETIENTENRKESNGNMENVKESIEITESMKESVADIENTEKSIENTENIENVEDVKESVQIIENMENRKESIGNIENINESVGNAGIIVKPIGSNENIENKEQSTENSAESMKKNSTGSKEITSPSLETEIVREDSTENFFKDIPLREWSQQVDKISELSTSTEKLNNGSDEGECNLVYEGANSITNSDLDDTVVLIRSEQNKKVMEQEEVKKELEKSLDKIDTRSKVAETVGMEAEEERDSSNSLNRIEIPSPPSTTRNCASSSIRIETKEIGVQAEICHSNSLKSIESQSPLSKAEKTKEIEVQDKNDNRNFSRQSSPIVINEDLASRVNFPHAILNKFSQMRRSTEFGNDCDASNTKFLRKEKLHESAPDLRLKDEKGEENKSKAKTSKGSLKERLFKIVDNILEIDQRAKKKRKRRGEMKVAPSSLQEVETSNDEDEESIPKPKRQKIVEVLSNKWRNEGISKTKQNFQSVKTDQNFTIEASHSGAIPKRPVQKSQKIKNKKKKRDEKSGEIETIFEDGIEYVEVDLPLDSPKKKRNKSKVSRSFGIEIGVESTEKQLEDSRLEIRSKLKKTGLSNSNRKRKLSDSEQLESKKKRFKNCNNEGPSVRGSTTKFDVFPK